MPGRKEPHSLPPHSIACKPIDGPAYNPVMATPVSYTHLTLPTILLV